ncbi:MAG: hypothetical protein QOC65_987, partial [Sphingomonadales bacterium]|nr:hypothetical protein [Sphingomonadales bacterium]
MNRRFVRGSGKVATAFEGVAGRAGRVGAAAMLLAFAAPAAAQR